MELAGRSKAKVLGRDERQAEPGSTTGNAQQTFCIKVRHPPQELGEVYLVRKPDDNSAEFLPVSAQSQNAPPVQNGLFAVFNDLSLTVFQEAIGQSLYDYFFGSRISLDTSSVFDVAVGMNYATGGHENALHEQLYAWHLEQDEGREPNVFQFVADYPLIQGDDDSAQAAMSLSDEGQLKIVAKPLPSDDGYNSSLFMLISQDGLSMAPKSNL